MRNVCILLLLVFAVSLWGNEGIPFFRNYSSVEYGGHNRNFDVVSGKDGVTYFANFEGLLSYDNSTWRMIYTPGYSRITRLFIDSRGVLWVGGYHIIAKVITDKNGQNRLEPVVSDAGKSRIGEVQDIFEEKGRIYFHTNEKELYEIADNIVRKVFEPACENSDENNGYKNVISTMPTSNLKKMEINQSLLLRNGYRVLATQHDGLIVLDKGGGRLYSITEANGLCSNSIKRITEAENGCVWGVTDNGVFRVYIPSVFSHYTQDENLKGEVTTIQRCRQQLYIGTLQGLYAANGSTVARISSITQACWQLLLTADGKLYAATSNGVFEIEGSKAHQLTHGYALSLAGEVSGQLYVGEMDGIYKLSFQRKERIYEKIESFDKIIQLTWDRHDGLIAKNLIGDIYYKDKNNERFITKGSQPADNRLSCRWRTTEWRTDAEGKNIAAFSGEAKSRLSKRNECLASLKEKTIRTIFVESDSLIWLGGDFGAIKVDFNEKDAAFNHFPQVFIREVNKRIDTLRFGGDYLREISFRFSSDALPIHRNIEYQYLLEGYEDNWSAWTDIPEKRYTNLAYGTYAFKVRAKDSFGRYSTVKEKRFDIPWPFYLKWYSVVFYILLFASLVYGGIRWRLRKLVWEKENLEKIVASRTSELRHAQADLVRQEKMATVGKLTKGLIDRILNPLNYINNFSHLSSGLVGDLRENLRLVETSMNRENYEESMDVLDMMTSNLSKIEEHGRSTSRILKAMEEVLKERGKQTKRMDIVALCRQSLDLLGEYYKEDISRMQVSLQTNFLFEPMMIQGNEEQLGKTLMSLLNNGMYAISKKYGKQAYPPEISVSIKQEDGFVSICLRDNGIGIEEGIQEQIFDPFFTTKTTGEAAGVGLYLSKEIITSHNGNIQVHSCKDEYTEFIIKLPVE